MYPMDPFKESVEVSESIEAGSINFEIPQYVTCGLSCLHPKVYY